ncbi:hypothetical protein EB796_025031 [Bugula neritina]|uniref:Uncharacterized protein n=1 Tax=Bugula neritina TaxID=10212 RepID=A0A7J7ITC6_BUGNE|nr:hypothetical protein EB796_025031 [Bugula neritina]
MFLDNSFWHTVHRVDLCYGSVSQKRETSQTKQSMKWIHHITGSISKPSLYLLCNQNGLVLKYRTYATPIVALTVTITQIV